MSLILNIKLFLAAIPFFFGLDMVWIGLIAKRFYDKQFNLFDRVLRWPPAILVYLVIPLGSILFVLPKAGKNPLMGLFWGAVYGLVVYSVYDLTNLATFKKWTLATTLVDIVWGTILNALGGLFLVYVSKLIK